MVTPMAVSAAWATWKMLAINMGGLVAPILYVLDKKQSKVTTFMQLPTAFGPLADLRMDITDPPAVADFLAFVNSNIVPTAYVAAVEVASIS
jgi:hypothetical protein